MTTKKVNKEQPEPSSEISGKDTKTEEFYKVPKSLINTTVQLLMKVNNVEVGQVLQVVNILQKCEIISKQLKSTK